MELKKHAHPPQWMKRLFKWYCRPDRYEELAGDLEEMHALRTTRSKKWMADFGFGWDVVRCYKHYARRPDYVLDTSGALFKSFFKLSIRNMIKNKWSVMVNVLGLGFALAFCTICYLLYGYNREFDQNYNADEVFRIHAIRNGNGFTERYEITPLYLETLLEQDHSAVEDVVSCLLAPINLKKDKYYFQSDLFFVSPSWLDVFHLPLKYGSKEAFPLHGIYLSEENAMRLFGDVNPTGETLSLFYFGRKMKDVEVLGVFKRLPVNSSFQFEGMLNLKSLINHFEMDPNSWNTKGFNYGQYVKLSSADKSQEVEKHMQSYLEAHNEINSARKIDRFELIPFKDPSILESSPIGYVNYPFGFQEFLIFTVMAALILFIACFNLANTNIALMGSRVKEIGIRKTIGSSTLQVFSQFVFETFIVMVLAFLVALSFTNFLSDFVFDSYRSKIHLEDLNLTGILVFVLVFLLVITLLTGLAPALYSRRFRPITIINHRLNFKGLGITHYVLSVFQYSLAIAILIAGISFTQNAEFVKSRDFGYNPDNLMVIRLHDGQEYKVLKTELEKQPFSKDIFGSYHYLSGYCWSADLTIGNEQFEVDHYQVADDYLTQMGVKMIGGRDFETGNIQDIKQNVIVNEHFVNQFMQGDPLLQRIKVNDEYRTIVGVSENHMEDESFFSNQPNPIIYTATSDENKDCLFLRTHGENETEVLVQVEETWNELMDRPMVWHWQKEYAYFSTMQESKEVADIFLALALVAFLLSFISIGSMAHLHVTRQIKQISIRKVLGASSGDIITHINKPFFKMLSIAMIFGVGLGYFLSDAVLSSIYAIYSEVSFSMGIAIGLGILMIALMMIRGAIHRPLQSNPANGLRTE